VQSGESAMSFSHTMRFSPSKLNVAAAGALQLGRAHSLAMYRTYRSGPGTPWMVGRHPARP